MKAHCLRQETPDPGLGARLRAERKRLRLTQAGFATAAGISTPTQAGYELGTRTPDINYLARIEQLGVDGRYVRSGTREEAHAVKVLDWDRYAEIRDVVAEWVRDMEIEMTTRQLVEVESLIYKLCIEDPAGVEHAAEHVLRLVSSR